MTQRFPTHQLDSSTLAYLRTVVRAGGRRMPGIFHAKSNYWPVIGLLLGLMVLFVTLVMTFPPTEEPTKEALLQTAGFLLGGWLVLAAFRVWIARAAGRSLGSFTYADALTLYEVAGDDVTITDLSDLLEARATRVQNDSGYASTDISLRLGSGSHEFAMYADIQGRRMTVFLNTLAYISGGGEDGNDTRLQALSPFEAAGYARHVALTGEFPRSITEVEEIESMELPSPTQSAGRLSGGFIWYLAIFAAGAIMFVGFRGCNKLVREDLIYNRIKELPSKEQPPALRLYLSHPEFQKHRADAVAKLDQSYSQAAAQLVNGKNESFRDALRELIKGLPKKAQPVISLVVQEDGGFPLDAEGKSRVESVARELADKWGSTIGDELVIFARPSDPEIKGMIQVEYHFLNGEIAFSVSLRHGPDEEPFSRIDGTLKSPVLGMQASVGNLATLLLEESCGQTRIRPPMPIDDDF